MFWHMRIIMSSVVRVPLSVCVDLIYPYGKHLAPLPDGPGTKAGMKSDAESAK